MLGHVALDEDGGFLGIEPGGQVIESDVDGFQLEAAGVGVVGGQGVPVGDKEVALVLGGVLQLDPVGQCAHVVAQMQLACGAHSTEDARA